jgi:hypothetical protein
MKTLVNDKEKYFEQYKLYVDSAEKVSNKRMSSNSYFLAINTGLISLLGLVLSSKTTLIDEKFIVITGILGVVVCIIWFLIILSYKQLNSGKFALIHKIEKELPIRLFFEEWEMLGKGEDVKKYFPISHVELLVPFVFLIFYVFLILSSVKIRLPIFDFPKIFGLICVQLF